MIYKYQLKVLLSMQTLTASIPLTQRIFDHPTKYRKALLEANLITGNKDAFSGKSFICVSLTRFCPVGCKFCFFKSGPVFKKATHEDLMTPEGMDRFIDFSNNVNLGYLLVSGGGEPMMERKSILKIIEKVDSERIVLVTSAHWAKTRDAASRYLSDIKNALSKRSSETTLTVRVSVDSEHTATLTLDPIINLINLFYEEYYNIPQLELQIHSLEGDLAIDELIKLLEGEFTILRGKVLESRISDGKNALKIVPSQELITFNNMQIKVGFAKTFYSNLRVNVHDHKVRQRNIDVYQKDLFDSEDGNPSIVTNKLGNPGLDFWVNYNGNVTTWGNQYLDNLFNLYVDTTDDVINGTLTDPAALAFIEKGAIYRDKVVSEANEIAVMRSKAVNIRDYAGALMFDEARTRLYFTIRVLQDYINENRISDKVIQNLSDELKNILKIERADLIQAYNNSSFTIIEETIEKGFDNENILDILEWIRLGHYKLEEKQIQKLVDFYNENVPIEEKISSFNDLRHNIKMQVVRMTEHLTHIKPEALNLEESNSLAS